VPFFRQRAHGLGKEREGLYKKCQLSPLGAERMSHHAEKISHVHPLLEKTVFFLAENVELETKLKTARLVLHMRKRGLAVLAQSHDATGGDNPGILRVLVLPKSTIGLENVGKRVLPEKALLDEGIVPLFVPKTFEFFPAPEENLLLRRLCVPLFLSLHNRRSLQPFPAMRAVPPPRLQPFAAY
jgi:hypothetical protein